jgi:hypothetical protein
MKSSYRNEKGNAERCYAPAREVNIRIRQRTVALPARHAYPATAAIASSRAMVHRFAATLMLTGMPPGG